MITKLAPIEIRDNSFLTWEFPKLSSALYSQWPGLEKYYHLGNSCILEAFEDTIPESFYKPIINQFLHEYNHFTFSVIKCNPGVVIPIHKDKYWRAKQRWGQDINPQRRLIFLEDWKSGHYVEYNNEPIVKWRKGDVILIGPEWHLGGNMGQEPFYSAQFSTF